MSLKGISENWSSISDTFIWESPSSPGVKDIVMAMTTARSLLVRDMVLCGVVIWSKIMLWYYVY